MLCILISVMDEGGKECATATKPTLGSDVLQFGENVKIDQFIFFCESAIYQILSETLFVRLGIVGCR